MVSLVSNSLMNMTLEDATGSNGVNSGPNSIRLSTHSSASNSRRQSLFNISFSAEQDETTPTAATGSGISHIADDNASNEDLHLLAISAQITEVLYSISDIQTRIFEIQELRHQAVDVPDSSSTSENPVSESSVSAIDKALMDLDSKLETASKEFEELDNSVNNLNFSSSTSHARGLVAAKRNHVLQEWENAQKESEELRKELSDDKWLVVFRSVTEQADNMLTSLEKILTQCQNFMWQVQRRNIPEAFANKFAMLDDVPVVDLDQYATLADNLAAKKLHYVPSISKIMTMVDKGIRDHSKNGECLRRHADLSARWKSLRDRMTRVEAQMDQTKRVLATSDVMDSVSSVASSSGLPASFGGEQAKPHVVRLSLNKNRSPSSSVASFPTISPFRKLASKVSKTINSGKNTPTPPRETSAPHSDPTSRVRSRASRLFGRDIVDNLTPERVRHGHSQSLISPAQSTSSPSRSSVDNTPSKSKPRWNSSTKVVIESNTGTIRSRSSSRPSLGHNLFNVSPTAPPVPLLPPRSLSRSSHASSRPWSPFATTSTVSSQGLSMPEASKYGARPMTPSKRSKSRATDYGPLLTPRSRPMTPSLIPTPGKGRSVSVMSRTLGGRDDDRRTFSPNSSGRRSVMTERCTTPSRIPAPRLSSGQSSGLPSLTVSRPPSAFGRSIGAQTPEATLKAHTLKLPFYRGPNTPRPVLARGPPSSFRGAGLDSRLTPGADLEMDSRYIPNMVDPLDVEVAKTVNGIAHGFLIERVTAPLKSAPPEGQEQKAQYAVSNSLGRKVINCRLVVIKRMGAPGSEGTTKKVMCRVGGGWLDLHMYLLNHQMS